MKQPHSRDIPRFGKNFILFLSIACLCLQGFNPSIVYAAEGQSRDNPVVIVPLPFDQETDPYSLARKGDVLWFLFYANTGDNFVFEFTEASGAGRLLAALFNDADAPLFEYSKQLGDKLNFVIAFSAKATGNYYIRLSPDTDSSWRGTLKYYIGIVQTSSVPAAASGNQIPQVSTAPLQPLTQTKQTQVSKVTQVQPAKKAPPVNKQTQPKQKTEPASAVQAPQVPQAAQSSQTSQTAQPVHVPQVSQTFQSSQTQVKKSVSSLPVIKQVSSTQSKPAPILTKQTQSRQPVAVPQQTEQTQIKQTAAPAQSVQTQVKQAAPKAKTKQAKSKPAPAQFQTNLTQPVQPAPPARTEQTQAMQAAAPAPTRQTQVKEPEVITPAPAQAQVKKEEIKVPAIETAPVPVPKVQVKKAPVIQTPAVQTKPPVPGTIVPVKKTVAVKGVKTQSSAKSAGTAPKPAVDQAANRSGLSVPAETAKSRKVFPALVLVVTAGLVILLIAGFTFFRRRGSAGTGEVSADANPPLPGKKAVIEKIRRPRPAVKAAKSSKPGKRRKSGKSPARRKSSRS